MATQTAETTTSAPDGGEQEKTPQTAYAAATAYAGYDWPVLPGSTWNGHRFQVPGTDNTTDGVRPTVPRNYATTDQFTITQWWG